MSEWILGISCFYHDSAAALLRDGQLVIRPQADFFGLDTLEITAEDAFGSTASDVSFLTVRGINDRPELTPFADAVIDEDDTLVVHLPDHASDAETPFAELTITLEPSPGLSIDFDQPSGRLRAWAPADSFGVFQLATRLVDADLTVATAQDTIRILSVNDLPVMVLPSGLEMSQNDVGALSVAALDVFLDGAAKLRRTSAG